MNNTLANSRAFNNSNVGFTAQSGSGSNNFIGDTASNNSGYGFTAFTSSNSFTANTAFNNSGYGFSIQGGADNNVFYNNTALNNTQAGFTVFTGSGNNSLVNNTANYNPNDGFWLGFSSNNTMSNNTALDSSVGFYINYCNNTTVSLNNARLDTQGIYVSNSLGITVSGNNATNDSYGIQIGTSNGNNVSWNMLQNDSQYGIYVGSSGSNTISSNTEIGNLRGIILLSSSGNNVTGNNASSNGAIGIQLSNSSGNTLTSNWADYNSQHGMLLAAGSDSNTLDSNDATGNSWHGIQLTTGSSGDNITDNTANKNGWSGIAFDSSSGDILTGNSAHFNVFHGFHVANSVLITLTGNNASDNEQYGIYLFNSNDTTLSGNTATNDTDGISLSGATGVQISANTMENNSDSGLYAVGSSMVNATGNGFYGNNQYGIHLNGSYSSGFSGNDLSDPLAAEIMLSMGSNSSAFTSNNMTSEGHNGAIFVDKDGGTGNVFDSNRIMPYYQYDVVMLDGSNTFQNNYLMGGDIGFTVNSAGNQLINNTVLNASEYGTSMEDADGTAISGDHYYNNSVDMQVQSSGAPFSYGLSGVVFDEPAGDMQNFTTITLQDNVKLSSSYLLSWSPQPATPPAKDFAGKYLRISNLTPNVSIGSVTWQWSPSELTNYTESQFVLVRYDTSWSVVASNPNQTTHSMTAANLSPSSVYAIFQEPVPVTTPVVQPVVESPLSVDLTPNCTGNIVTVTSGGDISGAQVSIDNADNLADVASGMTNSDGRFVFQACGMRVRIRASHDGYQSADITLQTVDCQLCVECVTNANCADTDICANQKCVPLNCGGCSYPSDHQCVSYQCCSDSDCKGNETCVGHACKLPEKTFECYSDKDCAGNQQCLIQLGDKGGKCQNLTGCGLIQNHTITPYQCGSAPGCPACGYGQTCTDNACLTIGLKSPSTGFVGDKAPVQATQGNASCANCDLQITDPMGKVLTGMTDSAGNFSLPLLTIGEYKVAYIQNGTVIKVVEINALPKAPPPSGENPPTAAGGGAAGTAVFAVIGLLVLIIAGLVLMRRGKGGKPSTGQPKTQK